MEKVPVQSVKKALDALEFVVEKNLCGEKTTLATISQCIGSQPTTTRNILKTLEICGYLARGEGHEYLPGVKCFQMMRSSAAGLRLRERAQGPVHLFAERTGETCVVRALFNGEAKLLLKAESQQIIQVNINAQESRPFYDLATAWVLTAFASPKERMLIVSLHGYPDSLSGHPSTEESFEKMLADIRGKGFYAFTDHGVYQAAAPIFDETGAIIGALGAYMPESRTPQKRQAEILDCLRQTAEAITHNLE